MENNISEKKKFDPKKLAPYSKDELKKITEEIDKRLDTFIKTDYKNVLNYMGNLGKYSIQNIIYILIQNSKAKTCKSLRQWNYEGRSVKKGEHPLKIMAPIREITWEDKLDEDGNQVIDNKTMKPIKNRKEVIKGYKPAFVFDISQTDGKELNVFKFDETKTVEDKEAILRGLENVVKNKGYKITFVKHDELGDDTYGLCNKKEKVIKIRNDLSDLQTVSTAVHECGHALAHTDYRKDFAGLTPMERREIKEVEAESISCVVCTYLGLDTSNFNFSYIAGWGNGDISKFRENLKVISTHAQALIGGINEEFIKMRIEKCKAEKLNKENEKGKTPIVQELEFRPFVKGSQIPVLAPVQKKKEMEIA